MTVNININTLANQKWLVLHKFYGVSCGINIFPIHIIKHRSKAFPFHTPSHISQIFGRCFRTINISGAGSIFGNFCKRTIPDV